MEGLGGCGEGGGEVGLSKNDKNCYNGIMNVSLTPRLEQFVEKKVRAGLYQTASEVVREGLRLLQERDQLEKARLEELRGMIAVGIDQIDAGRTSRFDDAAVKRIRRSGRKKLAALRKKS